MEKIEVEDLKQEVNENELLFFCDSLATNLSTKFEYTIDYFDTTIGVLYSKESPTCANFCVSLLREILCNLKPSHELWDKIKYAAFLLNLATRNVEFNVLYDIYHQVEIEVLENNLRWRDKEVEISLDRKVTEKLIVKDDVCSLPDPDLTDSKTDLDFDTPLRIQPFKLNGTVKHHEDPVHFSGDDYDEVNGNEDLNSCEDIEEKLQEEFGVDKPEVKQENKRKRKAPTRRKTAASEKSLKERKKPRIRQSKRKAKCELDDYSETNNKGKLNDVCEEEKPRVPCHLCKHRARSQQELEKHAFEKHDANRLCTQCGHLSDTYKDFMKHNETHMFTCEVCHKKILGVRVLRAHMKLHETKQETNTITTTPESNKVPCDICGVLLQEISLKHHIAQVHSNEIHKCDMCDFTANTKYKITDHRKRHFVKMSNCPECGKQVKNLKRHFRRNCGGKKERHYCHLCEKSFSYKDSLYKHIKSIHQKIMDHHCDECDYKTYKKFNLKLHISKMHTKEEMKKVCTFCKLKTSNLEYHIKIYHYDDQVRSQSNISFPVQNPP